MKLWTNVLMVLVVLGLCGIVSAADAGKEQKKDKQQAQAKGINGIVVSVAADGKSIKIKAAKKDPAAEEKTVAVAENTKVKIDGKDGKVVDLAPGMRVRITPATGTVRKIDAKSKPAGKGGQKGDKQQKKQAK